MVALYVLSLPYYAGSTIGSRFAWRLEHGRLTLGPCPPHTEAFYIALNSEGLRFAPAYRFDDWNAWQATLPLWMPLLAAAVWSLWAWRVRARPGGGGCRTCGYCLAGISHAGAVCPECGKPVGGVMHTGRENPQ